MKSLVMMPKQNQKVQQLEMTPGAIRKRIIHLAWPVVVEMSLQTITQIVDMMMVGRVGAAAITAIGLSFSPLFLALSIFFAISIGTTALVARHIGAGEEREAGYVLYQSILLSLVGAAAMSVLFYFQAHRIILLMGAAEDVIPLGTSYIQWLTPGFVLISIGMIITAALRGAGETKTPMKVNILINIINVIANYVLIFGHLGFPALGVQGAALATSFSRGIGGILFLYIIYKGYSKLELPMTKGRLPIRPDLMKKILRIGFPAALEQVVMRIGQLFYVRLVASLGTVAYASHQIAINAESLSYMPGFGLATACTALVGQNLGAENVEGAEKSCLEAWKIGAFIMGSMGIIFLLFPEFLIRLYSSDPEIIRLGARNLRIVALGQIPMGTFFVIGGALRGAGDTRTVFYSTALATWVGRLGFTILFIHGFHWGLVGAWLAMVLDWVIRGILVIYYFFQGGWKKLKL